jgi:uncharacterized cupredoxin-like copper-binding protein/mono/diheme cytochrome c family protein
MNTGKQINAMVAVLFVTLIVIGAYTIWDPVRSSDAEERQEEKAAIRGATTFALNCRVCHGDRGQGGADGGRLAAAPVLDSPRLQGISQGTFNQAAYDDVFKLVSDTIMCGRVGRQMPTWGEDQGGTLNEEQIRQLAILITRDHWELAQEHADELDATTTGHAEVEMEGGSLNADATELEVSNARAFTLGEYIRIQEERLRVRPKSLEVERAVNGTAAAEHERGAAIAAVGTSPSPTPTRGAVRPPAPVLGEPIDDEVSAIPVTDTSTFGVGDVLQVDDEQVRVTAIITGIPSTNQKLAKEVGREPKKLLVTGAAGLDVGQTIRIEGELMEVISIVDEGETNAVVDQDTGVNDTLVSISDPVFFGAGYVVNVGDEQMRVIGPVDTRQTLAETIGRAQSHFSVSGTQGLSASMIIRLGEEEIEITEIISPARLELERGVPDVDENPTTAARHDAGTQFFAIQGAAEGDDEPPPPRATGQTLLEDTGSQDTSVVVTSTAAFSPGQNYLIGTELVQVTDVIPAEIRVKRAVNGTDLREHPRRSPVFEANLLEVERGANGTTATAHTADEPVLMTMLEVRRETAGTKVADHAKNTELFLGNQLIVQRGSLGTEAAEHPNGELVRDFPVAPDSPPNTGSACGQLPPPEESPPPAATPIPGGADVSVSLEEYTVSADPASIAAGAVNFNVSNDGTIVHNFRVIQTDLAPEALPIAADGLTVDEGAVTVAGGFTNTLAAEGEQLTPIQQLAPGSYVLICNISGHYEQGMRTAFTVTP